MSLRTRLFLVLAALVGGLMAAQWWLVRSLSEELDREIDNVTLTVGGSVASVLSAEAKPRQLHQILLSRDDAVLVGPRSDDTSTNGGPTAAPSGQVPGLHLEQLPSPDELKQIIERHQITADDPDVIETIVFRRALRPGEEQDADERDEVGNEGHHTFGPVAWSMTKLEDGETMTVDLRGPDHEFRETRAEDGLRTVWTTRTQYVVRADGDGAAEEVTATAEATVDGTFVASEIHEPNGGDAAHRPRTATRIVRMPASDGTVDVSGTLLGAPAGELRVHLERAPDARFLWLLQPDVSARMPLPESGLDEKMAEFRRQLLLGSGLLFALGLLLAALVAHRVSAPLRDLASASEEVGRGALGTQVAVRGADQEVRSTLTAFNRMSSRLAELDTKARNLAALRHLGEIGDVARGLAHTLRNPLNALGLTVEELAARADAAPNEAGRGGSASRLAEAARRQIRRIDRGIRSFLVLASPSGGLVDLVDVEGLARDVALEAAQDSSGRAKLRVERAGDGAIPAVDAVEAELRAVLQALVVNAVEASPEGGEVEIRIAAADTAADTEDDAPRVHVEIRDQGPGLAAEVRERLFTPHVSTKANGSGMGLFLAHRLATERYGGRLELLDRDQGPDEVPGTVAILEIGPRRDLEREDEPAPNVAPLHEPAAPAGAGA